MRRFLEAGSPLDALYGISKIEAQGIKNGSLTVSEGRRDGHLSGGLKLHPLLCLAIDSVCHDRGFDCL